MRQGLSSMKGDTALKNKKQQEVRRGKTLRGEEEAYQTESLRARLRGSSDLSEPQKSPNFDPAGRVDPDGRRMSWPKGGQRRAPWRPQLDMKLIRVQGYDPSILVTANQIAYSWCCAVSSKMAWFPQNMSLWHTDYFELKVLRKSQCKKDALTLLCEVPRER